MNEKQAKRIRRTMRSYVVENARSLGESMSPHVLTAEQQANVYARQLGVMWPALNHKQRGIVGADIKGFERGYITHHLLRALRHAIEFVIA